MIGLPVRVMVTSCNPLLWVPTDDLGDCLAAALRPPPTRLVQRLFISYIEPLRPQWGVLRVRAAVVKGGWWVWIGVYVALVDKWGSAWKLRSSRARDIDSDTGYVVIWLRSLPNTRISHPTHFTQNVRVDENNPIWPVHRLQPWTSTQYQTSSPSSEMPHRSNFSIATWHLKISGNVNSGISSPTP